MIDIEFKYQVLLLCVEAAIFVGLGVWCLQRRAEGSWPLLAGLGALLVGAVMAVYALGSFESTFLRSHEVAEFVYVTEHLTTLLNTVRAFGAALLIAGFVQSRRTPVAASGSIYGS